MGGKTVKGPKPSQTERLRVPQNTPQRSSSTNNDRPHFSFEYLTDPYCVTSCTKDEQASFPPALHTRSKMTWQELHQSGRLKLGYEQIARASIRGTTVPAAFTPDEALIAFRFSGKAPMVGIRRDRTFYVLWLDRAFELYDHG